MNTKLVDVSRPLALLVYVAASSACAADKDGQTQVAVQALCRASTLEPDLDALALTGPGVNPDTGELDLPSGTSYVVSSTYGVPKPGEDGAGVSARYLTLFDGVSKQLAKQPGLVAMQLSSSETCGSGRTLAIWASEEMMYDFVTSQAHLAAMSAAPEILQPGYAVTHWTATSADQATFVEAVRHLGEQD